MAGRAAQRGLGQRVDGASVGPCYCALGASGSGAQAARHRLDTSHEVCCIDIKSQGEPRDRVQARIAEPVLQRRDVRPVDRGTIRQRFLAQREFMSALPHPVAKEALARRRTLASACHGSHAIRMTTRGKPNRGNMRSGVSAE